MRIFLAIWEILQYNVEKENSKGELVQQAERKSSNFDPDT